jgi:hypothetical protein
MVHRFYSNPDFSGKPIGVQTNLGSKANQMEPAPDQYSDEDLKVHLSDGQIAVLGTQVITIASSETSVNSVAQLGTLGLDINVTL